MCKNLSFLDSKICPFQNKILHPKIILIPGKGYTKNNMRLQNVFLFASFDKKSLGRSF